jgi:hypothetical protein
MTAMQTARPWFLVFLSNLPLLSVTYGAETKLHNQDELGNISIPGAHAKEPKRDRFHFIT